MPVGYLSEVDKDSYAEFRDLILPHLSSLSLQESLLKGFPSTHQTVESDSDATSSNSNPVILLSVG